MPETTYYETQEECIHTGEVLAEWLTQDGERIEWRCVAVDQQR